MLLAQARKRLHGSMQYHRSPAAAVASLGGCQVTSLLLALAAIDPDDDGRIQSHEIERYNAVGRQIVEVSKAFLLNTGVVSALVLSVVFGLAYGEGEVLIAMSEKETFDYLSFIDVVSFVALQVAVALAFATMMASSRLYCVLGFWMPSLESQLWFINDSAALNDLMETAKNLTLFATLLALSLESAVTRTWLDAIAFLPLAIAAFAYVAFERYVARGAIEHVGGELDRYVHGGHMGHWIASDSATQGPLMVRGQPPLDVRLGERRLGSPVSYTLLPPSASKYDASLPRPTSLPPPPFPPPPSAPRRERPLPHEQYTYGDDFEKHLPPPRYSEYEEQQKLEPEVRGHRYVA